MYGFRRVAGDVDQYQGDRAKFEDMVVLLEFSMESWIQNHAA
jgi:hypothetical protein